MNMIRVIIFPTLATIPEVEYRFESCEFAVLIPRVIANRTAEAKALVNPLLVMAEKKGGEVPRCLAACAASLDEVSKAMSGLPMDVKEYTKVQSFLHKKFEAGVAPPLCKSGCPDKSCSADETAITISFMPSGS
uniref:Uncharacterized protein n=1 Tax=Leersia perrieri TaxID=77586 RepID=A0A0D9XTS8_9ORYZ